MRSPCERNLANAWRFLRKTLANGPNRQLNLPIWVQELEEQALAQGYSRSVLARAKMAITHSTRTGGIGAAGAWITSPNATAKPRSER